MKRSLPAGAAFGGYDLLLQRSRARQAFLHSADPTNQLFTMPLMVYYARLAGLGGTISEVLEPMFESRGTALLRLYDYGPFLAWETDIGGGRILEGAWPALARAAWAKTVAVLPSASLDFLETTNLASGVSEAVEAAMEKENPNVEDASLVG